jgi:pilus assembly protein CpaE
MSSRNSLFLISSRPLFFAEVERALTGAPYPRISGRTGISGGAQSGVEALRSGAASFLMVDMDGDPVEAMRLVRDVVADHPEARVLACSERRDSEIILDVMRAGAVDYLTVPLDRRVIEESMGRVARRGAGEPTGSLARGRVISFLSAKGGCGSSTVGVNLAAALCALPAREGRSLVMVDLDSPGGDISAMLQMAPTYSLADVAANTHRLDMDLLNSMLTRDETGVQCLASCGEGEHPTTLAAIGADRLASVVAFLHEHFDTVILAGGGLGEAEMGALNLAHMVHVVTTLDFLALRRAQGMIERLRAFGVTGDALRVVVNRHERAADLTMTDARDALEAPVVWSIPAEPRTADRAVNEGVPVITLGKSRLAASFEEYATSLAGGSTSSTARAGGLFRRLVPGRAGIAG